jgi:deazaflavin-dependent oxidoreductase (nitroreductase family)
MSRRPLVYCALAALAIVALVVGWARLPNSLFYKEGRPTRFGKATNRTMGRYAALGKMSFGMVTLDVPGRKSGRINSTVLVLTPHGGEEYLISMLGEGVDWVRNLRAADGRAVIRHGGRREVRLEEVDAAKRAPILKEYLKRAPGGRPHFPIGPDAPVEAFEPLAERYPVFRIARS